MSDRVRITCNPGKPLSPVTPGSVSPGGPFNVQRKSLLKSKLAATHHNSVMHKLNAVDESYPEL